MRRVIDFTEERLRRWQAARRRWPLDDDAARFAPRWSPPDVDHDVDHDVGTEPNHDAFGLWAGRGSRPSGRRDRRDPGGWTPGDGR